MAKDSPARPTEPSPSEATLLALDQIDNKTLSDLSQLSMPEIAQLKAEIADIFPAGNLPGLILAGLATLKGRRIARSRAEEDINALFQGASLVPQGLYSILIGGPAVVLATYQRILELTGKDVASAFPEGTWQFYLQFALREDTGRHTNETLAYHQQRPKEATLIDDISAWIMTAIYTLLDTDGLTGALWTEWTSLRLIREAAEHAGIADTPPFPNMMRIWQAARPYRTAAGVSYAEARRAAFDEFARAYIEELPTSAVQALGEKLHELAEAEREAYQHQLGLLATLKPDRFRDERRPVPLWDAKIGLIWRGHTYLFPVCARDAQGRPLVYTTDGGSWPLNFDGDGQPRDSDGRALLVQGGWLYRTSRSGSAEPVGYLTPIDPALVKGRVTSITQATRPPSSSTVGLRLVEAPRSQQERLRNLLPEPTRDALRELANVPILINWDEQDRSLTLGEIRQNAHRGIGDQPLTILRSASSIMFDQSHIFFDGIWGMAVSEVMTNQAISWCKALVGVRPQPAPLIEPLNLGGSAEFDDAVYEHSLTAQQREVDAETTDVQVDALERARKWLRQRGAGLTINDLLLFGRLLHAADYRPSPPAARLIAALDAPLRRQVVQSLQTTSIGANPALLIPMDASLILPRERIFPTTFRSPLTGLLDAYDDTVEAFKAYAAARDDPAWTRLKESRQTLVSYLGGFGEMLDTIKAIAMRGESVNTATLRLLGHLPASMQSLLNQLPERVGVLNEVLKGEEVFSNVGRVAAGSSLARFMSAKDDGRAKTLVWGIMTDDNGQMHISLRDFRPHVPVLIEHEQRAVAVSLAQDYVSTYAETLNRLAEHLIDIALADDIMRWD